MKLSQIALGLFSNVLCLALVYVLDIAIAPTFALAGVAMLATGIVYGMYLIGNKR
jgi:hypothetical protein